MPFKRKKNFTVRKNRPLDGILAPVAAFSVSKLLSSYSGFAMRVRRSSDNTELDIPFVNNELDRSTLLAFVGVGAGFVSTWYNQVGSKHLVNSNPATQPQIMLTGLQIKPWVQFNPASSLIGNPVMANCNEMDLLTVHTETSRVNSIAWSLAQTPNIRAQAHIPWSDGVIYFDINLTPPFDDRRVSVSQVASVGQLKLVEFIHSKINNRLAIRENNVDRASNVASTVTVLNGQVALGNNPIAAGGFNGSFSEFILFDRDLSTADRNAISQSIKSRYNI